MNVLSQEYTKDFWKKVRENKCFENYRAELFALWETDCSQEITELPFSVFRLYSQNGDRATYESLYFRRRRAISAASLLALIYPEEEKYLIRLMDELFAITNEYTWCIPAHCRNIHDWSEHEIDLFETETAFALSEIYLLLEDRLDPVLKKRIYDEVNRRVIIPYREKTEKYDWESLTNNWAAVCSASVAGAVMCLRPDLFEELEPRFTNTCNHFLSGFKKDAMCLEGVSYWHYGFGLFVVYADMVRTFTDGRIDYFAREDVKNVSTFMQKMYLSGSACVSFADGPRKTRYHLGLLHRLKKEYPDDVLVYHPSMSYNYDDCARFCLHLRSALWLSETYYDHPDETPKDFSFYAEDSHWFVKKTPFYGFAAKGGNNQEHHNHNDVGSFIFAQNGKQILMDAGVGKYNKKYFSAERYDLFHTSSRGHSVPVINGAFQKEGVQYGAKDVQYKDGVFSVDIAGAYGCEGLKSLRRSFAFKANAVILTDEIEYLGEGAVTERFVSFVEPVQESGFIRLGDCVFKFDQTVAPPVVTKVDEEKEGLFGYTIDFVLPFGAKEFSIIIEA